VDSETRLEHSLLDKYLYSVTRKQEGMILYVLVLVLDLMILLCSGASVQGGGGQGRHGPLVFYSRGP